MGRLTKVFTFTMAAGLALSAVPAAAVARVETGAPGAPGAQVELGASAAQGAPGAPGAPPSAVAPAAAAKVKITFNANGGKVGKAKKKTVTRAPGAKLGKLPKATKAGFRFKGWYTKQAGGKKIAAKTTVKKKVTYYAHWERALSSVEKKLVGTWGIYWDGGTVYRFYGDGTYIMYAHFTMFNDMRARGFWSIDKDVLTLVAQWSTAYSSYSDGYFEEWGYYWRPWGEPETAVYGVRFGVADADSSFAGKDYVDLLRPNSEFETAMNRYIRDRIGSVPDF
ncbi:MAG: InlB B-repeat-containing protein [Micrococcales bacterium]|nr:InlB B-repeat-containing protein [Micrococcales bacterium]